VASPEAMRGSTLTGWATYIVEECEAPHAKYHSEQAGPKEPPVQHAPAALALVEACLQTTPL